MIHFVTLYLVAVFSLAAGWWLGVAFTTKGMADDLAELEQMSLQLDLDRRNLRASQRETFNLAVRTVIRDTPLPPARPELKAGWLS